MAKGTPANARTVIAETLETVSRLPACRGCGLPVKFGGLHECEDCYADKAGRYHGKAQTVNTIISLKD